ncbi:MAG: hypothetical protein RLZZ74_3505 [Cyanobacteriota bacterium]|jgi:hypothetical protein
MKRTLDLIDQLIFMEQQRDLEWKKLMVSLHRSKEAVGESPTLMYLRNLRELAEAEFLALIRVPPDKVLY